MPSGALRLDLDVLNVKNNFMHPLFWQESTKNEPQVGTPIRILEDKTCLSVPHTDIFLFFLCILVQNVKNNFIHPLFWQESTKNEPQVGIPARIFHECEIGLDNLSPGTGICLLASQIEYSAILPVSTKLIFLACIR